MEKKLTISELEEIGNNWYNRTHKLREIWMEQEPVGTLRHLKAYVLWSKMVQRTMKIVNILIENRQSFQPKGMKPGGISLNQ